MAKYVLGVLMVVMAVVSATGRHEHKQGALRAEPARTPCNFKNFWKQIKVECDDPAAVTSAAICKQARNCLGIKATPAETERDNTRLVKLPDGSNCKSTTPAPEDVKSAQQCESACRLTATCKGSVWSGTSCAFCTSLDVTPPGDEPKQPSGESPVVMLKYDGSTFEAADDELTCDHKAPFAAGSGNFGKCEAACKDSGKCQGFVYYVKEGGNNLCWHCKKKVLRETKVKGCTMAGEQVPCCTTFLKIQADGSKTSLPTLQVKRQIAGGAMTPLYINYVVDGDNRYLASSTAVRFPDPASSWISKSIDYRGLVDTCSVPLGVDGPSQMAREAGCNDRFRCGCGIAKADDQGAIQAIYVTGGLQLELQYSDEPNKSFQCNSLRWRYTVCQLPKPVSKFEWNI